jgi:Tol biopolymer transport system component
VPWGLSARDAAQASPSRGTAANGLVVFQAYVGYTSQLFTIKPDGSGLKQITKIPFKEDTPGAEQADWSPDGTKIVWHKLSPTVDQLFLMDTNGGHVRKLTKLPRGSTPSHAKWGTAAG